MINPGLEGSNGPAAAPAATLGANPGSRHSFSLWRGRSSIFILALVEIKLMAICSGCILYTELTVLKAGCVAGGPEWPLLPARLV